MGSGLWREPRPSCRSPQPPFASHGLHPTPTAPACTGARSITLHCAALLLHCPPSALRSLCIARCTLLPLLTSCGHQVLSAVAKSADPAQFPSIARSLAGPVGIKKLLLVLEMVGGCFRCCSTGAWPLPLFSRPPPLPTPPNPTPTNTLPPRTRAHVIAVADRGVACGCPCRALQAHLSGDVTLASFRTACAMVGVPVRRDMAGAGGPV